MKILGAEDVPQSGLGQQPGAVVGVLHVGHAHGGVTDPVVDHRVHRHRHAVLGQDLTETLVMRNIIISIITSCGGTPSVIVLRSTF